jgi:sulfonate transport system substrate-binding protein
LKIFTSAQRQSNARILSDGSNDLASYKRYYLSSAAFADRRSDILNVIFGKLDETGKWVKAHPKDAAASSVSPTHFSRKDCFR